MKQILLSDMKDFRVGNAQMGDLTKFPTGCTAILCPEGATAGVDVRGGSPASRETELLKPVNTVQQIHAVMLSGGSAFGLEVGDGAMQFLAEKGIGFDTGFGKVPIVCGCSLFDLEMQEGDGIKVTPDKNCGYRACINAFSNREPDQGNYGAGTGATIGKLKGPDYMMKSGLGFYAVQLGDLQLAAIVAVNALGDVMDYDTKELIAGLLTEDKTDLADTVEEFYKEIEKPHDLWKGNTTIGCIITNAKLDKCQCNKLASIAHNGYAQAIRPVHTSADGDTIFVMASGKVECGADAVGCLATECMARAINEAVYNARTEFNVPGIDYFYLK